MGGFWQRLAGKAVVAVLGLVLWMGYVTTCDGGDATEVSEVTELPSVVFGGGGGMLAIDVDLNQPGQLKASFERWNEADESELIASFQALAAGDHHFAVDVADAAYGYFEVGIPQPSVGARIAWTVSLDGEPLDSEQLELDDPLEPGYAFFVQFEFEEIGELRQYARR